MGEELTFDYFGCDDEVSVSPIPTEESQVSASASLSSLSGETTTLTGNGLTTKRKLLNLLQEKFVRLQGTDVCPTLAFDTNS